jgi:hypothetical protein
MVDEDVDGLEPMSGRCQQVHLVRRLRKPGCLQGVSQVCRVQHTVCENGARAVVTLLQWHCRNGQKQLVMNKMPAST